MNALAETVFEQSSPIPRTRKPTYEIEAYTSRLVRVPAPRSSWVSSLHARFEELSQLPVGWDGYSGRSVSFHVASFAANLLERLCVDEVPAPNIVPGGDGTLQIEWHRNGFDIEIHIQAQQEVFCYRQDLQNGYEEELRLTNDFSVLQTWIDDLV